MSDLDSSPQPHGSALTPIIGISWPRSGHHLLVRMLTLYFGDRFGYCEFHGGLPPTPDTITACCRSVPCKHSRSVVFTKNHDFDLKTPKLYGQRYLIQYRDFVPSIVSNFELHLRKGVPDTFENFRTIASQDFSRYKAFMQKWVWSGFGDAHLMMTYDALVTNPAQQLAKAVAMFDPDSEIDQTHLEACVARVDGERIERKRINPLPGSGVHKSRDVTQFRHYRPALFDNLARLQLDRHRVINTFKRIMGRPPAEAIVIDLQCFDSLAALETHLIGSDEYRDRSI